MTGFETVAGRIWLLPYLSKENLFKNAKGRLYLLLACPTFVIFKVQVVIEPFTCQRGKSLLVECHPIVLHLSGHIATNT